MSRVTIVKPPIGDQPIWVREAWVGLSLPTENAGGPSYHTAAGLPFGQKVIVGLAAKAILPGLDPKGSPSTMLEGYSVPCLEALAVLESSHPEAANWWRENSPDLLKAGRTLIFNSDACRLDP